MITFDDDRVEFTPPRGGGRYYLAPMNLDDVTSMVEVLKMSEADQAKALPDLLARKAASDSPAWVLRLLGRKQPSEAVASLSIAHQVQLFREWMTVNKGAAKVVPGESSGSAA